MYGLAKLLKNGNSRVAWFGTSSYLESCEVMAGLCPGSELLATSAGPQKSKKHVSEIIFVPKLPVI